MDCKPYKKLNTSLCILLIVSILLCKGDIKDTLTTAQVKPDTVTSEEAAVLIAEAEQNGRIDRTEEEGNEKSDGVYSLADSGTLVSLTPLPSEDIPGLIGNEGDNAKENAEDNNATASADELIPGGTLEDETEDTEPAETVEPLDKTDTVEITGIEEEPAETGSPEPTEAPRPTAPITYQEVQAILKDPSKINEQGIPYIAELPTESNDARYEYITGHGYKAYTVGHMPEGYTSESVAYRNMVEITVPVWKMRSDGSRYSSTYTIPINEKLAISAICIFTEIYNLDIKFPFRYLAGFMYRKVGGVGLKNSPLMSAHSFGVAVDINPADEDNDYFLGKGNDLRDMSNPYCVTDEVIAIFEKYGWNWGGNFDICSDTMHFQYFGLEFLQYENPDEPFPILEYGSDANDKAALKNLQDRLVKLGYLEKTYSKFNSKVRTAVKNFQEDMGIPVTGKVTYGTWEPLINLTHDMGYVF